MLQRIKDRRIADEGGFTLIELLVVIIILGFLAAVVVFSVAGIGDRGKGSACKIDTRTLRTAEEAYAGSPAGNGNYAVQATLVAQGFLSEASTLHDIPAATITADDPATAGVNEASFVITVADIQCGTVGQPVGGANL